jgi:hypothetical protein
MCASQTDLPRERASSPVLMISISQRSGIRKPAIERGTFDNAECSE